MIAETALPLTRIVPSRERAVPKRRGEDKWSIFRRSALPSLPSHSECLARAEYSVQHGNIHGDQPARGRCPSARYGNRIIRMGDNNGYRAYSIGFRQRIRADVHQDSWWPLSSL